MSKQFTQLHCTSNHICSSAIQHSICWYFNTVQGVWQQVIQYNRCVVCSNFSLRWITWLVCISTGNVTDMLKGTNMSVKFRESWQKQRIYVH